MEEIITSSIEVFKDVQSDMAGEIGKLCYPTPETAESNVILEQNANA
jgi:hypothetical protein